MKTTKVELRVGETAQVTLEEMGSCGYLWDMNALARPGIVSVDVTQDIGDPASIGGATSKVLTVRGQREGITHTTHSRPWMTPDAEDDILEVVVHPRQDGLRLHDFWKGKLFSLNERNMYCVDVASSYLIAALADDKLAPLCILSEADLSHAVELPWEHWLVRRDASDLRGSLWQHRRGGLYVIVEEGVMEATMQPSVTYRGVAIGDVYTRDWQEFMDGEEGKRRFERIA